MGEEPTKSNASGSWWQDTKKAASAVTSYVRCYDTHPALKLVKDGTEYEIYGGSCLNPKVQDAQVYVGFDTGMKLGHAYAWEGGIETMYPITDMQAPQKPERFKVFITWLCNQLHEGKKIHLGCMGGHGRTGLVLSALVKEFMGIEDAITYVRNGYCKKAVESQVQVDFLHQHFGITKVAPYKGPDYYKGKVSGKTYTGSDSYSGYEPAPHKQLSFYEQDGIEVHPYGKSGRKDVTIRPVPSSKCVWGDALKI